ncbi:MAG: sensor histidine kinase N-terminal domain-containing protein [Proteobacteria bacterium]|nr:sensor histidine kinase N-terminal domain-containing protein [Pseudomonadota bacterium]
MRSIRLRLLLPLMAMLGCAALAMGALTYRSVLAEAEGLFDYQLSQMALSLRDQGEIDPAQVPYADPRFDFVVQIWSVDGRLIYGSRAPADLPARALLGFADIVVRGQTWRTFGATAPGRVIQVAQPLETRRRLAANAALRSVAPLLYVAPLLGAAIWWLAALTLAPLRRVATDVAARDEESLQPLPTGHLPDEVAPLVAALNTLLQRLAASRDAQRAFVADAAHELRSPLTALKLQLQLLRRAPDDAARGDALDAIGAGIERAARLVEQLLVLARNEPGASPPAGEAADLADVVRQAAEDAQPLATQGGSTITVSAAQGVPVAGDAAALRILARNLIDNALRYAPPGARVEVRVAADAAGALLEVDDSGPGIPEADRERVFDRFYRRANVDETGSGLGLAIVRSIADRHDAQIRLRGSPLGGLGVTVRFPPVPSPVG